MGIINSLNENNVKVVIILNGYLKYFFSESFNWIKFLGKFNAIVSFYPNFTIFRFRFFPFINQSKNCYRKLKNSTKITVHWKDLNPSTRL